VQVTTPGLEQAGAPSLSQFKDMIGQMSGVWAAVTCSNASPQPSMWSSSPQWDSSPKRNMFPFVSCGGSNCDVKEDSLECGSNPGPKALLAKGHMALKVLHEVKVPKITEWSKSQQYVLRKRGKTIFVVTFAGAPPQQCQKGSASESENYWFSARHLTSFQ